MNYNLPDRIYFFTAILFLFTAALHAQNMEQLDSVVQLIKSPPDDTTKLKALIYAGRIYTKASNFDSAVVYFDRAISFANELPESKIKSDAYYRKGKMLQILKSDHRTAIGYFQEYYNVSKRIGERSDEADALHCLGNVYLYLSDYEKSLNYYIGAAKLNAELGNEKWMANDYTNMAIIYMRQKSYDKAIDILEKSGVIYRKLNFAEGLSASYKNLGVCYSETGLDDKALDYYGKSVLIEEQSPDAQLAGTYNDIASVYTRKKDPATALKYYQKSAELLRQFPDDYGQVYCYQGFGTVYNQMKQFRKAEDYLAKAEKIASAGGMKYELMDCYQLMSENYAALNDFSSAFKYRTLQAELQDTIHNEDSRNAFAEMQTKYETDVKEKEITLLKNEQVINALAIEKQRVYTWSAIGGIVLLLVITVLFYSRYRTKRLLSEKLERLSIVARSTDNIVIIMDAEGRVEWANESFSRMNGISIEELKKKKGETIYEISNNEQIKDHVEKAIQTRHSVVYESRNMNVDGEVIWEQSMLTPVFDENGRLQRMIIVDTNITQRKMDEQLIQEKNKDIIDSINYAKRIQDAILPSEEKRKEMFPDSFIFFKARDIVSGDFYWYAENGSKKIIAAVDCTGHGVPGALMSMIGNAFLNEVVSKRNITNPGAILSELRHLVISTLKQSAVQGENKDGMDIALIALDTETNVLEYAGANNPLWIIRTGTDGKKFMDEVKPDKRPIGFFQGKGLPFQNQVVEWKKGDTIFVFTDGFADQFGGPAGKKFKYKNLKELLLSTDELPADQRKDKLEKVFDDWRGNLEQVDDVLVIGVRL